MLPDDLKRYTAPDAFALFAEAHAYEAFFALLALMFLADRIGWLT